LGDLTSRMKDFDATATQLNGYRLTDQSPGHAVRVALDFDATVALHSPLQQARGCKWRLARDRLERTGLAREACYRRFARGAVHTHIGNLAYPPLEMGFQRGEARKLAPGEGVVFYIAHPALVLALGACSIRGTGMRHKLP